MRPNEVARKPLSRRTSQATNGTGKSAAIKVGRGTIIRIMMILTPDIYYFSGRILELGAGAHVIECGSCYLARKSNPFHCNCGRRQKAGNVSTSATEQSLATTFYGTQVR